MSCLPIRLPQHRTKLHPAKQIRKRRFQLNNSLPWLAFRTPKPLHLPLRQKRKLYKPSFTRLLGRKQQLIMTRKQGTVYVDNPFTVDLEKPEVKLGLKKTEENGEDHEDRNGAGEMWESLASPLMNEINDRAKHFIARFRADMEIV